MSCHKPKQPFGHITGSNIFVRGGLPHRPAAIDARYKIPALQFRVYIKIGARPQNALLAVLTGSNEARTPVFATPGNQLERVLANPETCRLLLVGTSR